MALEVGPGSRAGIPVPRAPASPACRHDAGASGRARRNFYRDDRARRRGPILRRGGANCVGASTLAPALFGAGDEVVPKGERGRLLARIQATLAEMSNERIAWPAEILDAFRGGRAACLSTSPEIVRSDPRQPGSMTGHPPIVRSIGVFQSSGRRRPACRTGPPPDRRSHRSSPAPASPRRARRDRSSPRG